MIKSLHPGVRAWLGLLVLSHSCIVAAQDAPGAPPNVVVIISDDQHWADYGFMGHKAVETPHLDKLAAQSVLYPRGYVPSSLCCPSLATIISGLYPHQSRITSNDPPSRAQQKRQDFE